MSCHNCNTTQNLIRNVCCQERVCKQCIVSVAEKLAIRYTNKLVKCACCSQFKMWKFFVPVDCCSEKYCFDCTKSIISSTQKIEQKIQEIMSYQTEMLISCLPCEREEEKKKSKKKEDVECMVCYTTKKQDEIAPTKCCSFKICYDCLYENGKDECAQCRGEVSYYLPTSKRIPFNVIVSKQRRIERLEMDVEMAEYLSREARRRY